VSGSVFSPASDITESKILSASFGINEELLEKLIKLQEKIIKELV
jgi:hypothetical protein